ncbi:MAG: hypothetical protein H6767_04515 [Candidatus Peribacteria bacterium]|nr:MAG: hypothetical protein H6767_04515 [Candidatus Peribacteria bacterium]
MTLRISEGTKVKDIEKKVLRNVKNKLRVNKTGITAFTLPDYEGEGVITLEDANTPVYVYLGDSVETDVKYAIDYDVAIDSDLNGGKDDDIDNTGKKSLSDGSPQRIVLNDMREQVIRLMLIDGEDTVIDSFDITIVKNYIEEATIDMSTIRFNGVTDSERAKIETLKNMVTALPSEHKLKAMMYLSQLQDEWFDETQKTRVIIEFEGYVDSTGVSNAEDFIELLESLLVEGQADQSDKNIAYNALKALVPADIACDFDGEYADCKTYMISVLDTIYASTSVDDRRLLGTELLDVIKDDTSMTDKQKIDFKAVLKLLVYAGVDNIPDDEKEEVVQETDTTGEESSSGGVLQTIGFWLLVLI